MTHPATIATRGWSLEELGFDGMHEAQDWWESEAWEQIHDNAGYDPTDKRYFDLIQAFYHIYGIPLVSRTRVVFRTGDGYVIKVPITEEGVAANVYEVRLSSSENPIFPMAKTEFYKEHPVPCYLAVVKAEEVDPICYPQDEADFPDWVFIVDCQQVGYTKSGELVAYDA